MVGSGPYGVDPRESEMENVSVGATDCALALLIFHPPCFPHAVANESLKSVTCGCPKPAMVEIRE